MRYPENMEPVLAEIHHQGALGAGAWSEVVYYDEENREWRSFSGSKTFKDGEQVSCWIYVKDCWDNKKYVHG